MLTQKAKYAIKALIFLAQQDGLTKTQQIATHARIPKKFLESILLELKSHSLVASQQGAHGGYFLQRSAKDINLADIHRIFEGPVALVLCAASEAFYQPCADCEDVQTCGIRLAMRQVRAQTLMAMEAITIDKIAHGEINAVL